MATFQTLTTSKYFPSGVYIGQLIQPSPAAVNAPRIPCYIGRGSRFAYASDLQIRRSFISGEPLTFPNTPPFLSPLEHNSTNQKANSRVVRSDGVVVKTNQWDFVFDNTTGTYNKVIINPEAYDPNISYTIDYQSSDRDVRDFLPVDDVRQVVALGLSPGSPDFEEYVDYFLNYDVTDVTAPASATFSFSSVTRVSGSGLGTVSFASSNTYTHPYNRFYQLRCVEVGGAPGSRYAVFAWQATPMSGGNTDVANNKANGPNVPTKSTNSTIPSSSSFKPNTDPNADLDYPRIVVNEGSLTTATLEYGIALQFDWTAGQFSATSPNDDLFTFNAYGPAKFDVDERLNVNTNQLHEAGDITPGANNGTTVSVSFAASNAPNNECNALYKLECIAAPAGAYASATHSDANGDVAFTNKLSGLIGNDNPPTRNSKVVFVPGGAFNASFTNGIVTVTYVTNSGSLANILVSGSAGHSLLTGLSGMVAADVGRYITISGAASASNNGTFLITQYVSPTSVVIQNVGAITPDANNGAISWDNSTTFAEVVSAVNALSASTMRAEQTVGSANSVIIIPPAPPTYELALSGGVDNQGTFAWCEYGSNINVGGTFTYTQLTTSTPNMVKGLSNNVYIELDASHDNFKPASQATYVYSPGGADEVTFTARQPGMSGNDYTVAVTGSGSTVAVSMSSNSVVITLSGGGPNATVAAVVTALNAKGLPVFAPVTADITPIVAFTAQSLTGGQDADTFTFYVRAPRQFYQAKDSRTVSLTVSAKSNDPAGSGTVSGSYVSNTPEGGFGTFTATANSNIPSSTSYQNGSFVLPGNVLMFARNLFGGPTNQQVGNAHQVGQEHSFSLLMGSLDFKGERHSTIDWSLVRYATETIDARDVLVDVAGLVTGVPSARYLILRYVPDTILSVKNAATNADLSYTAIAGTQYVSLAVAPATGSKVKVTYKYRGAEPNPGDFYFLTGKYIRPDEFYNTPILITSLDEGRKLLNPPEMLNHLAIMNEIVMGDIGAPAMYIVQVKDPDLDGVYTDVDFKNAIKASEAPSDITDLVVLSHFSSLNDQLSSVTNMSDPFKQRFRLAWIGAPTDTKVGNENQPDSLVYLAQRTLQTYGTSPAHGTRILVAPTVATRDIVIDNSTTVEVSLDGSFVAGALAAFVAAFADPGQDILRKVLPGFKTIQTYGERGSPDNMTLGSNNIIFFTNRGNGVYMMEENVTVDNTAPDFLYINNMTQKMAVTKTVTEQLDANVIGTVVPSADAGVALIAGFLLSTLSNLVSQGIIGNYQTSDGRNRPIDSSQDIKVQRDSVDPSRYHIMYNYFLRNTIKRITGLYTVNSNNFGAGL